LGGSAIKRKSKFKRSEQDWPEELVVPGNEGNMLAPGRREDVEFWGNKKGVRKTLGQGKKKKKRLKMDLKNGGSTRGWRVKGGNGGKSKGIAKRKKDRGRHLKKTEEQQEGQGEGADALGGGGGEVAKIKDGGGVISEKGPGGGYAPHGGERTPMK